MAILTPIKRINLSPTLSLDLKRDTRLLFLDTPSSSSQSGFTGPLFDRWNVHRVKSIDEIPLELAQHSYAAVFITTDIGDRLRFFVESCRRCSLFPETSIVVLLQEEQNVEDYVELLDQGADDLLCFSMPCRVMEQRIRRYETLYHQIQDMRALNDKLQTTNQQLEEYVYIVSHDLKAPLRGLSSLSEFIEQELGPEISREVSGLLQMMKSRTERMQQMIDGILHYCRMANSMDETTEVDVKLLINNIIDLISPPNNVRISYPDRMPVLRTQKIKIHEVFQNLIMNGIKHNDKQDIRIDITFRDLGDRFEFAIQDNGKGIKPEYQEKVFGFFQTLVPKDRAEGTGLGLTIVKKIVETQEGKITLESDYGKGSVFRFTWRK